jgi:phosphatidate cytidylyltransferase
LFWLIACYSLWEYQRLVAHINPGYADISKGHRLFILVAATGILLLLSNDHFRFIGRSSNAWGMDLLIIALVFIPLSDIFFNRFRFKYMLYSFLGLTYIALSFGLLINMRLEKSWHDFPLLPLGLIICIWINDTMAYIVGSLVGRTKFFPSISPKKTWEGTIGGIILTMVAAALFGYYTQYYTVTDWVIIAGLASIAGTAGDLLESKLKRMAHVKDSGHIMPGHGGFLDRFDSLLLATPFVWWYAELMIQ